MKKISFAFSLIMLSLLVGNCTKDKANAESAYVKATIGTIAFYSSTDKVNVGEDANPQGGTTGGTEQVTITAESEASTGTDKDYLVIAFGYKAGDIKTYSIQQKEAISAYHKSGSGDDIAQTGTVTITDNKVSDFSLGRYLHGTFDITTQKGVHVSNGTFTVYVNY